MPWDSFRRRRDSSAKKDESLQRQLYQQQQQQQQHDQQPTTSGSFTHQPQVPSASNSSLGSVRATAHKEGHSRSTSKGTGALSKEMVQKLREVENETSTLKANCGQGLSSRVTDR